MKELEKQKLLLRAIFKSCGGPTELQELTGIPRQNFTNWQLRGKVPVLKAIDISSELNISHWGLNYVDFCKLYEDPPPWDQVVKSYFLPKGVIAKLLKGDSKCQKKKKRKKNRKE
jgi:hypothetical protein